MNILRKLNTLLRAGARESAGRITDANAIRIYRQEIVDAESLLERRRLGLAGLIATRKDLEREMTSSRGRIRHREQLIAGLKPEERTAELLTLAAREIATTETHLAQLQQRQLGVIERIGDEELTLRKLLSEIREHRREMRILAAEVASSRRPHSRGYGSTVAAHLAALRDTREAIAGTVVDSTVAEESFAEASDRVDGDPLDRELANRGRDPASRQLADVLARLRSLPCPAEAAL